MVAQHQGARMLSCRGDSEQASMAQQATPGPPARPGAECARSRPSPHGGACSVEPRRGGARGRCDGTRWRLGRFVRRCARLDPHCRRGLPAPGRGPPARQAGSRVRRLPERGRGTGGDADDLRVEAAEVSDLLDDEGCRRLHPVRRPTARRRPPMVTGCARSRRLRLRPFGRNVGTRIRAMFSRPEAHTVAKWRSFSWCSYPPWLA